MITLTADEQDLRKFLIDTITAADPTDLQSSCMDYGAAAMLGQQLGPGQKPPGFPRYTVLIKQLFHISSYELQRGRPMLSALVTSKSTSVPGDGFFQLAEQYGRSVAPDQWAQFWRAELQQLHGFWAGNVPARVVADSFDRIMVELSAIKKQLK